MKDTRLPHGSSDPISFTCTCAASSHPNGTGGTVLLFYRYFAAEPPLPSSHLSLANDPASLAAFHRRLTERLSLGGKIRIAKEGFNVTVGGTTSDIETYIQACILHWSFSNLGLHSEAERRLFFKPTKGGCACVFGGAPASVQVKAEITPMGVTDYAPADWDSVESLSPEVFHERCFEQGNKELVDVRNHYESKIGYFVDPVTEEEAIRPGIRRFSQWPLYVKRFMTGEEDEGRASGSQGRLIMAYCTGGIRCEKGVRWMQEKMSKREGDRVCTLKGGIVAYLIWMDEEIREGRKTPQDSLFKGRNYVFDARGSVGLSDDVAVEPVSRCHVCHIPSDRLSKCHSKGCHLVLVVCHGCEENTVTCCVSCREFYQKSISADQILGPRAICDCEKKRESQLWSGIYTKSLQSQNGTGEYHDGGEKDKFDIQLKIFD